MKHFYTILVLCFSLFAFEQASATVITANAGGGNWNAVGSWDLGRVPGCGDTIVIPPGVAIQVTATVTMGGIGCLPVKMSVSGTLGFNNGRKLRLPAGSCVQVQFGGRVNPSGVGGGHSETIEVGGVDLWWSALGSLVGGAGGVSLGCPVLLPVELISYDIEYLNEQASLSFTTASEREIDYFVIEVSTDGSFWQELAKIEAEGTAATGKTYQVKDKLPFSGVSYYRLSHVDVNGEKAILETIVGEYATEKFLLYPVPVNKTLFVEGRHLDGASVSIVSSLGESVQVEPIYVGDKLSFNFGEIKSGVYFLTIENQFVKKTERIVVVHK